MKEFEFYGRRHEKTDFLTRGMRAAWLMELETMNLLDYSEDLREWLAINATVSQLAGFGRYPTTNRTILSNTAGGTSYVSQNFLRAFAGDPMIFTVEIRAGQPSNVGDTAEISITDGGGTTVAKSITLNADWTEYSVDLPPLAAFSYCGVRITLPTTTGDRMEVCHPRAHRGTTPNPYVATSNKRIVYDYSGNRQHAYFGVEGSFGRPAFIDPISRPMALDLPGRAEQIAWMPSWLTPNDKFTIDTRVFKRSAWSASGLQTIGSQYMTIGDQRSWLVGLNASGNPFAWVSSDGTSGTTGTLTAPSAVSLAPGQPIWLRFEIERVAGDKGYGTFYESLDGVNWTSLGTDSNNLITDVHTSTGRVVMGNYNDTGDGIYPWEGQILNFIFRNGGYSPTLEFNPERDASGDTNLFSDGTSGFAWTVEQEGASTNNPNWTPKGILLDQTSFDQAVSADISAGEGFPEGAMGMVFRNDAVGATQGLTGFSLDTGNDWCAMYVNTDNGYVEGFVRDGSEGFPYSLYGRVESVSWDDFHFTLFSQGPYLVVDGTEVVTWSGSDQTAWADKISVNADYNLTWDSGGTPGLLAGIIAMAFLTDSAYGATDAATMRAAARELVASRDITLP